MRNLFEANDLELTLARVKSITADTKPVWGKMTADQVMAHLNVAYDMAYTDKYTKARGVKKFLLKIFVKSAVVGPKPYPKNGRTAPEFIISDQRNFGLEQAKLIEHLIKTQALGETHFHNKESNSFGALTSKEWNVLFAKHIDHHLTQFGV